MGKQQRGNGSSDQDEIVRPWWENISYEGFLKLANSTFKPELFLRLTGNEFKLLTYVTFLRWRFAEGNGRLRLGHDYLVNGTGLSNGTVRRCMKSLEKKFFLRLLRIDRNNGNSYLVYTVLLLDSSDQIDRTAKSSDQFDRTVRSKKTDAHGRVGTASDQIDQEDHIQTNRGNGASRHSPKTIAGGVAADPSEGERRSPDGQDRTSEEEGVALAGDNIRSWSEEWRAAVDTADDKAAKEKAAVERAKAEAKRARDFFRIQVGEYTKAREAGHLTAEEFRQKVQAVAAATGQPCNFIDPAKPAKKKRPVGSGAGSNSHARI